MIMAKNDYSEHIKIASIFLCVAMILAIFDLPYGYYTILRFSVLLGGGYIVYMLYTIDGFENLYIFILIGMIFLWNPIFPIYMEKSSWLVFNMIGAGVFGYLAYSIGK